MRLPLSTLEAFNAVAKFRSMRCAADSLGVKPSTISHQLKALEEKLGTSVFIRTTRSIKMTEAGTVLYKATSPAFSQLSVAYESARSSTGSSNGLLKLDVSDLAYDILIEPVLKEFCTNYPDLSIEISVSDGLSNIVEDGMHAGFSKGKNIAEDMVAIEVMPSLLMGIFASPGYLASHGTPLCPDDLQKHSCIRYRYPNSKRIEEWEIVSEGTVEAHAVSGKLITTTRSSQVDLCLKDLGLIYTLREYCADQIESGELVPVMEEYLSDSSSIYIYFPSEYRSITPLRLLLDFLAAKYNKRLL